MNLCTTPNEWPILHICKNWQGSAFPLTTKTDNCCQPLIFSISPDWQTDTGKNMWKSEGSIHQMTAVCSQRSLILTHVLYISLNAASIWGNPWPQICTFLGYRASDSRAYKDNKRIVTIILKNTITIRMQILLLDLTPHKTSPSTYTFNFDSVNKNTLLTSIFFSNNSHCCSPNCQLR